MKRWETINIEIKKNLTSEEFKAHVGPFQTEIKETVKSSKKNLKFAYRDIRARILEDTRVNLALLEAAAHEETLCGK